MSGADERMRDRLVAAATEARRDAAAARQESTELAARLDRALRRNDELTSQIARLTTAERTIREQAEANRAAVTAERDRALRDAEILRRDKEILQRDKEVYRQRLRAQYDLRWTRIGAVLRTVLRKPWTLPLLPVRLVGALRRVPKPT